MMARKTMVTIREDKDDDDAILADLGGQVVTGGEVLEPEEDEYSNITTITTTPRGLSRPLISFYLQRTWFCPLTKDQPWK